MSLTLHTLAPNKGSHTKSFRVGRGLSSGRGKTAGRGTKGQRSRTGGRNKLKLKGMKQMLLSFPKMRGFQSRYDKSISVPLERLEAFESGTTVTLELLKQKKMVRRSDRGAKIVGGGELTKKLTIQNLEASTSAKAAIEKAGGKLVTVKAKS